MRRTSVLITAPLLFGTVLWFQHKEIRLGYAIHNGDLGMALTLLRQGANPNTVWAIEGGPVAFAAERRNWELLRVAVAHGGSPDKPYSGETALGWLAVAPVSGDKPEDMLKMVEYLLKNGADPNTPTGSEGLTSTPLILFTMCGNEKFGESGAAMLLRYKADPDRRGTIGITALQGAAKLGRWGIASMLVNSGADPNASNLAGITAFQRAVFGGAPGLLIRQMIEAGAPRQVAGKDGDSPLIMLGIEGDYDRIAELIDAGLDPNFGTTKGASALAFSVVLKDAKTVEVLLAMGADPNAGSPRPLALAREVSSQEIVAVLEKVGAKD